MSPPSTTTDAGTGTGTGKDTATNTTLGKEIKALTFDMFGTVVDWRTSIEASLTRSLHSRIASPSFSSLPPSVQTRAKELSSGPPSAWPSGFATEWRKSYFRFTSSFVPGITPWKDVDAHHLESLSSLLSSWGLAGLYPPGDSSASSGADDSKNEETLLGLSRAWHRLTAWPDAADGITLLKTQGGYVTAAFSNGNTSLLRDLASQAHTGGKTLDFDHFFSAQDFGAYKPNPQTYLGVASRLGLEPGQVAMVAQHLWDLEGARACGLRTVYVERVGEVVSSASATASTEEETEGEEGKVKEEQDLDRYKNAREWVDVWVSLGEGGFVEVARRLRVGKKEE